MPANLDNLDPESRAILEQAMSMQSNNLVMGMDPTRQKEQAQLAADMERKNDEARRRRGAAIAGEDMQPTAPKQTPIKRRRKGMVEQDSIIKPVAELPPEPDEPSPEQLGALMKNAFHAVNNEPAVPPPAMPDVKSEAPAPRVQVVKQEPVKKKIPEQELIDRPFDISADNPDFNAFTRISRLPSEGLFYPGDLYGQSLKIIDNYTLDAIAADKSDTITGVTAILGRRMRGIDPMDVLTIDEPYLLHWLRASSFPENGLPYPGYDCPHCGFDTDTDIEFRDYKIGFRQLKFKLTKDIKAVYELHRAQGYHKTFLPDGRECHVYLRRRRHGATVNDFVADWNDTHEEQLGADMLRVVGIAAIVEIEGCENMDEKVDYISNIPSRDRKKFEEAIVEGTVACDIFVSLNCKRCGGVVETPYPFLIQELISGLQ